jgi:hypothetical protein
LTGDKEFTSKQGQKKKKKGMNSHSELIPCHYLADSHFETKLLQDLLIP